MALFKKISRKFQRSFLRSLNNRREMSRLDLENHPAAKPLGNALKAALEKSVYPDEKIRVDRIEELRRVLNASAEKVTTSDYGAGSMVSNLEYGKIGDRSVVTRTVGDICRNASKPERWAFLLFKLIREFKPRVCIELGTCLGISTAYQAAALELDGQGTITTLEGQEAFFTIAAGNFKKLGLERVHGKVGRFQEILKDVLHELKRIDYAFIDGHHEEQATLDYFNQIHPFLSENAVVVFDDIAWSEGMERAWKALVADRRVGLAVDLVYMGICIASPSSGMRKHFKVVLE